MRARAVLAAGVALGLSVGATVASWSDAEHGVGGFAASRFVVQSNVQNAGWTEAPTTPGTTVTADMSGLLPGSVRYLQVQLRATAGSVAGSVALSGATLSGAGATTLGAELQYRVVRTTAACAAAAFSSAATYVVGNGASPAPVRRALTAGQEAGVVTAVAAGAPAAPGTATGLCFEIVLPTSSATTSQGQTVSATWRLRSVSG